MKEKDLIEVLARKAGDTLMKHFRRDWALLKERSTAKEAVTEYDKAVDRLSVEEIKRHYPHQSLLTEESGFLQGDPWKPQTSDLLFSNKKLHEKILSLLSSQP
jgi:fructose-1,6-bisphosphatase/inositol monophosphatase family enzyme